MDTVTVTTPRTMACRLRMHHRCGGHVVTREPGDRGKLVIVPCECRCHSH